LNARCANFISDAAASVPNGFSTLPRRISARMPVTPSNIFFITCGRKGSRPVQVDIGSVKKAAEGRRSPKREALTHDSQIARSVVECASPLALCRAESLQNFRMNFDHQTLSEPLLLFLDRNLQVSFHKPTMKAIDGKVSHAQSRACSAA
jgi:hypothetical protein